MGGKIGTNCVLSQPLPWGFVPPVQSLAVSALPPAVSRAIRPRIARGSVGQIDLLTDLVDSIAYAPFSLSLRKGGARSRFAQTCLFSSDRKHPTRNHSAALLLHPFTTPDPTAAVFTAYTPPPAPTTGARRIKLAEGGAWSRSWPKAKAWVLPGPATKWRPAPCAALRSSISTRPRRRFFSAQVHLRRHPVSTLAAVLCQRQAGGRARSPPTLGRVSSRQ
jgi:hypothetical protein